MRIRSTTHGIIRIESILDEFPNFAVTVRTQFAPQSGGINMPATGDVEINELPSLIKALQLAIDLIECGGITT